MVPVNDLGQHPHNKLPWRPQQVEIVIVMCLNIMDSNYREIDLFIRLKSFY